MELQDKAGKFLMEMRSKLLVYEQYKDQVPSDTTGKSYPFTIKMMEDGVAEISLTVSCADLECTDHRFVHERGIDFSFDGKTITLVVKRNGFGRPVDTPQYKAVSRALKDNYERTLRALRNPSALSYWSAKRQGLL